MTLEKVTFGDNLPGFIAGDPKAPAVLVIQEWWGVTDACKELAEIIMAQGYRVLIPDLYKGKIGVDMEEAAHLMGALDFKVAVNEIRQGVDFLKAGGSPKVGCAGFCMGGALTLAALASDVGLDSGCPFYGTADRSSFDTTLIKVPVMAFFGEQDTHMGFSDPETARNYVADLKAAGVDITLNLYPSAGHGFMNALATKSNGKATLEKFNNPIPSKEDVDQAQADLVAFLEKTLKA